MFIVTLDGNRRVIQFFTPKSPMEYYDNHQEDASKAFIDRSQFSSTYRLIEFKRNFRDYEVTTEGKLNRVTV